MKHTYISILILLAVFTALAAGCGLVKPGENDSAGMEYTVVSEEEIPDELAEIIQDKCRNPFKLTYATKEYLYIVVGYGAQATGGYSVQVNGMYQDTDAIHFDTDLIGPENGENVSDGETYPYIVVKIEYVDTSVVFE